MKEIIALIDPFSSEAKEYLAAVASISSLDQNIQERALHRYRWKKGDTKTLPPELIDPKDLKLSLQEELSTFFFVLQALCAKKMLYTSVARFILSCEQVLMSNRLKLLFKEEGEQRILEILSRFFKGLPVTKKTVDAWIIDSTSIEIPKTDIFRISPDRDSSYYAVRWSALTKIFENNTPLVDYYLRSGYIVLPLPTFCDVYSKLFLYRIKEYIADTSKKMEKIEVHPIISEFSDKLLDEFRSEVEYTSSEGASAAKFDPTRFPPCIKIILGGLGAGNRHYGITVILTSFLSYARLCPQSREDVKISDCIEDISIVTEEIMPLIEDAASNCDPPFFKDQPEERTNIYYSLGFGLTEEPKLALSGRSKWYMCPNCEKIKREIPIICVPDKLCQKIKNPLQYYTARDREP